MLPLRTWAVAQQSPLQLSGDGTLDHIVIDPVRPLLVLRLVAAQESVPVPTVKAIAAGCGVKHLGGCASDC